MNNKLTILSFGGGQDSTAIFYKLIYSKIFRKKYAPDMLIVVFADTMNEHQETYEHIEWIKKLCRVHHIYFAHIKPDDGYHSKSWSQGLIKFYESGNRVGSKCFPKTCTDNLKIQPIYKWLDVFLYSKYGYGILDSKNQLLKTGIKSWAQKNGKIDVLIGIAKGEEKRASSNDESIHRWMRESINKVYPLIDLGMNRQDCQNYIQSIGEETPLPSNCILCPFMSLQELLYMFRVMPHWFNKWVDLERNKIDANHQVKNNMGVWGKKLLPEVLEEAITKYGHMTTSELREYKMSHGHCVKSKY